MNFRVGLSLSTLALAACAAQPARPPTLPAEVVTKTRVVDTACDWTKPIYLNKADVLSDDTVLAILAHNKAGAEKCGWKPLK